MEAEVWAYDEPHPTGGNCHVTLTKRQAIEWTKKAYPELELSDKEAFDDFITIHWAYPEKENK